MSKIEERSRHPTVLNAFLFVVNIAVILCLEWRKPLFLDCSPPPERDEVRADAHARP
jgi:hypothetical protein